MHLRALAPHWLFVFALPLLACSSAPAPVADAAVADAPALDASHSHDSATLDAPPASDATVSDATPAPDNGPATDPAHQALWIPPVIAGTTFDLALAASTRSFRTGAATPTMGYNGASFWGPTLRMRRGTRVTLNVRNGLAEDTTTHWHGLHLPAAMDGGPHQPIAAGATWSPSFDVTNNAGTYWYHPHLHHHTLEQLVKGAGGLIIIDDDAEAALPLPRTYGVDDIPLVLTSRRYNADNSFDTAGAYGDVLFVNGTVTPSVRLPAQLVRLRILNAEVERSYILGFPDNRTFYVIGTDGGLVETPIAVTRLQMAVGERYEILVDLSSAAVGSTLDLQSFNGGQALGFPGGEPGTGGMFGSALNNRTFDVLRIQVSEATAGAQRTVPTRLVSSTFPTDAQVTMRRTVAITDRGPGTPFTFDGVGYSEGVINQRVALNATEAWTITNGPTFGHSFHIHDVQFRILSRSTGALAPYEQGWKDTVFVPRNTSVTFAARFADYASPTDPFMYHCHMSNHEDEGLMGQFLVQ